MRLSVPERMAGTAIFILIATLVWGPVLLLLGMNLTELLADRLLNIGLIALAAGFQERQRRWNNRILEPLRGHRRHQVLRPLLGIGGIFLVQALAYTVLVPLLPIRESSAILGIANLLAGSTLQWVWGEKWRWVIAAWHQARRHLEEASGRVRAIAGRIARRG